MEWHEQDGVRWLGAELSGGAARAAFATRLGGSSSGAFESLNVGLLTDDRAASVRENRRRLAAGLGRDPRGFVMAKQVHGAELLRHEQPQKAAVYSDALPSPQEADAQATSVAELTPLVMTADCLPVALAGPGGVVMAHAGWRGLAAGVLERSATEVSAASAAIGPGIGPCCYEVGEEVLAAFADLEGVRSGRMLDLAAAARELLARAGVESIEASGLCTSCEAELFFSHRRDSGITGRQAAVAWIAGGEGE